MDDISYHIPVKSHVKKFLAAHVEIEPFKVTTNNEYGTLLFMCLGWKAWIPTEKRLEYNDRLLIRIPRWSCQRQGPYLSNNKIELFNEMVERMMKRELHIMLDEGNRNKGDIQKIINRFRDLYFITDCELEYHTLRKSYNRYRGISK